ncbi:MAG: DUF542 domain-containing protein, partial [Bacillota bacterium]|nr:DUF542 domain-containing protein [Bacillota bacterium]
KSMRIEEAVKIRPHIVELLSKHNIDFCCGGWQVLEDALKNKGLDVDSFVAELNQYEPLGEVDDWRKALNLGKEDLIRYIVDTHHRTEERLVEEVEKLLEKILYVHFEHHGESLTSIYQTFLSLKQDLMPHFADEEKVVFPNALRNPKTDWSKLRDDHDQVGQLLRKLQQLTNDFTPPSDACRTYRLAFEKLHELVDDIHLHVFLENSVLFEQGTL